MVMQSEPHALVVHDCNWPLNVGLPGYGGSNDNRG